MRYTARFAPASVSAAADIWEITAPSDATIRIWGFEVFQTSDTGDAAEEILALTAARATSATTSGSGGQTVTNTPRQKGWPAMGSTVEGLNTTQCSAGGGTITIDETFGWNVRVPRIHIWVPEFTPYVSPGDRWLLSMPAPADALTVGATLYWEEIGG